MTHPEQQENNANVNVYTFAILDHGSVIVAVPDSESTTSVEYANDFFIAVPAADTQAALCSVSVDEGLSWMQLNLNVKLQNAQWSLTTEPGFNTLVRFRPLI
jgi:hypothetical protein